MTTIADAGLSEDGKYRYWLTRKWDSRPLITFIMLNPSTADAQNDDPTIRRCMDFAERDGAGGIAVVNLFALRATNPKELHKHPAPIGPMNNHNILLWSTGVSKVILAWGAGGNYGGRAKAVLFLLGKSKNLYTLGATKNGMPRHPLYVRNDQGFIRYKS